MALASPQLELFALITPPASPCQQNTSDPNSLGEKRLPGQPAPFWRGSFCCCCHDVRARGSRSGRRRPLSPTSHLTHLIPPDVLQCRVMTVYPSSLPPTSSFPLPHPLPPSSPQPPLILPPSPSSSNNDHHTKPRHGDAPLLATSPLRHTISSCQLTTEISGVFASHKPEKNPPEPASLQPPSPSPRISDASLDSLRNLRRAAPSANSPTASTMSCPVKIRAPPPKW